MAFPDSQRIDTRPTLPSIHTLSLPDIRRPPRVDDLDDDLPTPRISRTPSQQHQSRNASLSSEVSSSRSSSPTDAVPTATPSPTFPFPGSNFCLRRTTFENADAFVVIPPPSLSPSETTGSQSPTSTSSPTEATRRGQAFLVVGEAMEQLRHPQRRLVRGARIHPYRIVARGPARRASTSSSTSTDA